MHLPHQLQIDFVPKHLWHYLSDRHKEALEAPRWPLPNDEPLLVPISKIAQKSVSDLAELYRYMSTHSEETEERERLIRAALPPILLSLTHAFLEGSLSPTSFLSCYHANRKVFQETTALALDALQLAQSNGDEADTAQDDVRALMDSMNQIVLCAGKAFGPPVDVLPKLDSALPNRIREAAYQADAALEGIATHALDKLAVDLFRTSPTEKELRALQHFARNYREWIVENSEPDYTIQIGSTRHLPVRKILLSTLSRDIADLYLCPKKRGTNVYAKRTEAEHLPLLVEYLECGAGALTRCNAEKLDQLERLVNAERSPEDNNSQDLDAYFLDDIRIARRTLKAKDHQ